MDGFSLVELMLSLTLGLALSGVMLQGLAADGNNSARFARVLRDRAWQRRTLDLIQSDLNKATTVSHSPEFEQYGCVLSGRTPVLHLFTPHGPITYSVGRSPCSIWRDRVLMRCGSAYGLHGEFQDRSNSQNRVLIDGLMKRSNGYFLLRHDMEGCFELDLQVGS